METISCLLTTAFHTTENFYLKVKLYSQAKRVQLYGGRNKGKPKMKDENFEFTFKMILCII